jgi:SAM-dependent MidA family methyltransferase
MDGPSLRRIDAPDIDSVASDEVLVGRIRAEIERDRPITFARFMELALYEPGHGYYRSPDRRPGREGDFLTAPEAHPIFGRCVARFVASVWSALDRPSPFTIVEYAAGAGALAEPLLAGVVTESPDLSAAIRYRPVEIERQRDAELRERLGAAGFLDAIAEDDAAPIVGVAIANELLDALPTHRVRVREGGLREVFVGWAGDRFVDVEGPPSTPALAQRLEREGVRLGEDQEAEVCLQLDRWIASAAAGVERGVLVLIDYGDRADRLYDPRHRPAGTLLAYVRHRAHGDLYRAIGRQDLTAHVDVTAIETAARSAGLEPLGVTTQGPFLAELGAGDLLVELQSGQGASLSAYLEARAALVRMIDPAAMGSFKVMAYGRGVPRGAHIRGLPAPQPHQTSPD